MGEWTPAVGGAETRASGLEMVSAQAAPTWRDIGDVDPVSALIADLRARAMTIAAAESLTGGGLAERLTSIPGASAAVRGGVVTYATDTKSSVLGVAPALIAEHGPVHSTTCAAMARHARMLFGSDVGVATTGVAGPDGQDGIAVGTVYVGVDITGGPARVESLHLDGGRVRIREQTIAAAVDLTRRLLPLAGSRDPSQA